MPDAGWGSLDGLVNVDRGMVSREIFVNEEIYRQEQEQVFARAWLFIGHESQIPAPGDFVVSSMGEESVILCRDRAGRIHVFLNSCRHRGMKVCRYDEGNTVEFMCPYHGWSYATDGALVGVPFRRTPTGAQLDRSRWGLIEVAQLENYKGTIWATWDAAAPSFLDYVGGYKLYLDLLLDAWDGREGGTEVIGGIHKWLIPCNWKFPAENFSGDRYHGVSHRSVDMVGIGPSGKGRRDMQERNEARWLDVSFPELGHSMIAFLRKHDSPLAPAYQDAPVVADYFRRCEEERQRRRGEYWRLFGGPGTMFPNTSPLARQPRTLAVWHPRGPAPDGGVAVVPRRRRRAAGGEGLPAPLLHPLLRAVGADRAGRHGELELRPRGEPRHHRAPVSLQLRDGPGPGDAELRGPRAEAAGHASAT